MRTIHIVIMICFFSLAYVSAQHSAAKSETSPPAVKMVPASFADLAENSWQPVYRTNLPGFE